MFSDERQGVSNQQKSNCSVVFLAKNKQSSNLHITGSLIPHVKGQKCKKRFHANIQRHTAHTIVSWPNQKQWVIVHTSDLMMITRQSIYILSIITKGMGKQKTRTMSGRHHKTLIMTFSVSSRILEITSRRFRRFELLHFHGWGSGQMDLSLVTRYTAMIWKVEICSGRTERASVTVTLVLESVRNRRHISSWNAVLPIPRFPSCSWERRFFSMGIHLPAREHIETVSRPIPIVVCPTIGAQYHSVHPCNGNQRNYQPFLGVVLNNCVCP